MSVVNLADARALEAQNDSRTIKAMQTVERLQDLVIRTPFPSDSVRGLCEELVGLCGPE